MAIQHEEAPLGNGIRSIGCNSTKSRFHVDESPAYLYQQLSNWASINPRKEKERAHRQSMNIIFKRNTKAEVPHRSARLECLTASKVEVTMTIETKM